MARNKTIRRWWTAIGVVAIALVALAAVVLRPVGVPPTSAAQPTAPQLTGLPPTTAPFTTAAPTTAPPTTAPPTTAPPTTAAPTTAPLTPAAPLTTPAGEAAQVSTGLQLDEAWSLTLKDKVGQSSPTVIAVDGRPAAAIGDLGGHLSAIDLATGAVRWSKGDGGDAIDAAVSTNGPLVFAGRSARSRASEIAAYRATTGALAWQAHPCNRTPCRQLSGLAVSNTMIFTGGPTQYFAGLTTGGRGRWSYLNSDTTNSTPAVANLTGAGPVVITTNDQTPNRKVGALSGGHLRITTRSGVALCDANIGGGPDAPGSFSSSPAIAAFRGAPLIVFGSGLSGTLKNRLVAYNAACQRAWVSPPLAGRTEGAPAIADVTGSGIPSVLEEVATYKGTAVVYELDGTTGQVTRQSILRDMSGATCQGVVLGTSSSVVTADLRGRGYQDLLVPAGSCGVVLLDGRTLERIGVLGSYCGVQNTPLVTADPGGALGITIAGYRGRQGGGAEGCVYHYTVPGGSLGSLGWPMFHHDPQLSGALTAEFALHDTIQTGMALRSGAALVSANGRFRAVMQADGTLVVQDRGSGKVRWARVTGRSGTTVRLGAASLAAISPGSKTLWKVRSRRIAHPMLLTLKPDGRLELSVHTGNEWARDINLWAV